MSSYDQNLLDEAPRATRAQLQEGYNVDLLEQPPRRTPSMRVPPPQALIPQNGSGEKLSATSAPKPRTSFWRTRNGIITIAVLVLVVIGAVVGGAVGGTVGKSSNNGVATSSTYSTTTPPASQSTVDQGTSTQTTLVSQGIGGGGARPTASG